MLKRLAIVVVALSAAAVSAQARDCTRDALKGMIADYFKAVHAHDMSALPTATNLRITENGRVIQPGEGIINSGGAVLLERDLIQSQRAAFHQGSGLDHSPVPRQMAHARVREVRPADYQRLKPDGLKLTSTACSLRSARVSMQLGADVDRVRRVNRPVAFLNVLDLALLVHDEGGAIGKLKLVIQDAVFLRDLPRHVAQKRKCDPDLFGECGVGGKSVDADAKNSGLLKVDLAGIDTRLVGLQLFRSTTGEGKHVER
jgi:hypothetical protein